MADEPIATGLNAGDVFVTAGARVDERGFEKFDRMYDRAAARPDIHKEIKVDYDQRMAGRVERDFQNVERQAGRLERTMGTLEARLSRMGGGGGGLGKLNLNLGFLGGRMGNIARAGALLFPVVNGLASALVALTGSLASAAAGAGALGVAMGGSLVASSLLGIGVVTRFQKVLEAYKAQQQGSQQATLAGAKALDTHSTSARASRDARERLTDAERQYAKAVLDAREAITQASKDEAKARTDVASAERELGQGRDDARRQMDDSVRAERAASSDLVRANQDVAAARRDAMQAQQDANRDAARSALDVKGAQLDLKDSQDAVGDAQKRVDDLRAQGKEGTREFYDAQKNLERANLAVAKSNAALKDAQDKSADAAKRQQDFQTKGPAAFEPYTRAVDAQAQALLKARDAAHAATEAQQQGVSGAPQVISALERVRSAREALNKSIRDTSRLQAAGVQGAEGVVAARRGLRDAREGVGDAAAGAASASQTTGVAKANLLVNQLDASERRLLATIHSLVGTFKRDLRPAQDEVFNGMSDGIKSATPLLDRLEGGYVSLGKAVGDQFRLLGRDLGGSRWGDALQSILSRSDDLVRELGRGFRDFLAILRNIAEAAMPDLVTQTGKAADKLGQWKRGTDDIGRTRSVIHTMVQDLRDWIRLFGDVGNLLIDVFAGGRREGSSFVRELDHAVVRLDHFITADPRGRAKLQEWFAKGRDTVKALAHFLGGVIDGIKAAIDVLRPFALTFGHVAELLLNIGNQGDTWKSLGQILGALAVAKFFGLIRAGELLLSLAAKRGAFTAIAAALAGGGAAAGAEGAAGAAAGGGILSRLLARFGVRGLGAAGAVVAGGVALHGAATATDRRTGIPTTGGTLGEVGRGLSQLNPLNLFRDPVGFLFGRSDPQQKLRDFGDKIKDLGGKLRDLPRGKLEALANEAVALERQFPDSTKQLDRFAQGARNIADRMDDLQPAMRDAMKGFSDMRRATVGHLKDIRQQTDFNMADIRDRLGKDSFAGKTALSANFKEAARQVQISMDHGQISTKTGLREIRRLLEQSLQVYGLTRAEAASYLDKTNIKPHGVGAGGQQAGGAALGGMADDIDHRAVGGWGPRVNGWIGNMGERGRDMVRAVLGRGEAVLNAAQQAWVNVGLQRLGMRGGLRDLFRKVRRPHHMAAGGIAGQYQGTAYGPPWEGIQGTGITATGVDLRGGPRKYIVAVDPTVIPLHTRVRAWPNPFGYHGSFAAEDTGGWIKGRHIDFYDWMGRGHQRAWGARTVSVQGSGYVGPLAGDSGAGAASVGRIRTRVPGAFGRIVQGALDVMRGAANRMLRGAASHAVPTGNLPGAIPAPSGVAGLGTFDGLPVASWIIDELRYARQHGWTGHISSGWRDPRRVIHPLPGAPVAPQGHSEHAGTQYPHGAVDFGSLAGVHDFLAHAAGYKGHQLIPLWSDIAGHMSGTGHSEGGFVEMAGGGGDVLDVHVGHSHRRGGTGTGSLGALQSRITAVIGQLKSPIPGLADRVSAVEGRYTAVENAYDKQPLSLIHLGDLNTPATVDDQAIAARARQLDALLALRQQVIELIRRQLERLDQARRVVARAVVRITNAMAGSKGKKRDAYARALGYYQNLDFDMGTDQLSLGNALTDATSDRDSLLAEKAGLTGTAQAAIGDLAPEQGGPGIPDLGGAPPEDTGDGGTATSPDLLAQLEQAQRQIASLTAGREVAEANLRAFSAVGDIGTGYRTALGAALDQGGVPQAPHQVVVGGQVYPAGTVVVLQQDFQMFHPADPTVKAAVAGATVDALSSQGFRPAVREEV